MSDKITFEHQICAFNGVNIKVTRSFSPSELVSKEQLDNITESVKKSAESLEGKINELKGQPSETEEIYEKKPKKKTTIKELRAQFDKWMEFTLMLVPENRGQSYDELYSKLFGRARPVSAQPKPFVLEALIKLQTIMEEWVFNFEQNSNERLRAEAAITMFKATMEDYDSINHFKEVLSQIKNKKSIASDEPLFIYLQGLTKTKSQQLITSKGEH